MSELPAPQYSPTGSLKATVIVGVVLVILSPVMSGIGQYQAVWTLAVAGLVTGVVAFGYSQTGRYSHVRGAGPLLFGAIIMPMWAFFASASLFADDAVMMCGIAIPGVPPNQIISKSLIPPGVLCFPDGYLSLPVLVTPPDKFLPHLVTLIFVLAPLGAALWLVLRTTKTPASS